jgi:hypothetical protein
VVSLGIHVTPYGWLYNVAGWDAVAITLCEGRRFALGTDDPHGLLDVIRPLIDEQGLQHQHTKAAQQRRTPKAGAVTWKRESRLRSGALGLFGNESISPVHGTSVKQLKFVHHLLRAHHGKSLFAFD